MGSWHARFWVCLALLSLLLELSQGPKPIGAWWATASVTTERNEDPLKPPCQVALAMTDSEGEEDGEDGAPDHEPLDEDPDGKPDPKPGEESGELGDEELPKKQSDPVHLASFRPYAFLGHVSGFLRSGRLTKLSDLTYRETPERPPRTA